ncbi:TRAP transporter large permease [Dethiosulfatarculus sandiegensis]|uniref:C4-dicarboxylate ABC transporter n=1 Tax=Dethiosulfatarculus sandiegensis TaxID=1429043 RepID=A0A0D2J3I1_9BACT|nr:TRAP transporter large permease subunit [Dethiosulfatarculus sandiegensis]KIX12759.1 C4-dicarboxylate ABC transporter [Dethiosulfatarculus sandiegensis]
MEVEHILVIAMFLTFIGLLFTGFPIAFVLGGVAMLYSLVGYLADIYLDTATGLDFNMIGMVVNRIYKLMSNWVLVAIPMFVFMGLMLDHSGIAERMMKNMQDLFGKVRGGLAITVALIGIILAASTGIIGASVVLLGVLSLPAMLRQGYSKTLALGTVAASGTLGILIPPSIMLVIMADQLSLSVGDLFMGAVFPGVILGALYIAYILITGLVKPQSAPLSPELRPLNMKVFIDVLKTIIPPAGLILLVLGSIFAGMTTPTEASGVGALGAMLLAAYNKRLSFKVIKQVTIDTFKTTGYIFGIFVGATCFALVLRLLGGDELIENALTGLPLGPYGIVAVILAVVFLLGFFLDWIEISLIILPLLAPVIKSLGFEIDGYGVVDNPELVWFTILVAVTLQTSFLTPPVGFAIFFLQGVAPKECTLMDTYKGVIPFVILQVTGLALVTLWPQLAVWLPAIAYD